MNSLKTLVKGVIKEIHPDKFALHGNDIQKANMRAVQRLTNLLATVNDAEIAVKRTGQCILSQTIGGTLTEDVYLLKGNGIKGSNMIFQIPSPLAHRKLLDRKSFSDSLDELVFNVKLGCRSLGLELPLLKDLDEEIKTRRHRVPISSNVEQQHEYSDAEQKQAYDIAYRHWITLEQRHKRQQRIARLFDQRRRLRESMDEEEQEILTATQRWISDKWGPTDIDTSVMERKSDKRVSDRGLAGFEDAVDLYLSKGNVQLGKGFGDDLILLEQSVVREFRSFLMTYATTLPFNYEVYEKVYFIIHEAQSWSNGTAIKIEKVGPRTIVEIPYPWSKKQLLRTLQDHIHNGYFEEFF